MSMLSNALDTLYGAVHDPDIAGELITYVVGADSVDLYAVLEATTNAPPNLIGLAPGQFDLAQPSSKNIDHDFSLLAADLTINGSPVTPYRGHLIKRTFGGSTKVYNVMSDSASGRIWEWQDGYDKRYLIHAKFVREE